MKKQTQWFSQDGDQMINFSLKKANRIELKALEIKPSLCLMSFKTITLRLGCIHRHFFKTI